MPLSYTNKRPSLSQRSQSYNSLSVLQISNSFIGAVYYVAASVILTAILTNLAGLNLAIAAVEQPVRGSTSPATDKINRPARKVEEKVDGASHITVSPTNEPRLVRVRPPAEQRLYNYLFGSPGTYLKHVRPVLDHASSVKVRLGVCIMTVDDIVEKDQTMLSTGCVKMKWIDEVLRWDPFSFDNLTWIVIPSTEIWIPDVALVNSPDPFHMTKKVSNVELSYTGEVGYYPSGRFSTRCPVTLTYFPFDAQLCQLQFESWAYPVQQLELIEWKEEPIDMKSFVTNHQWLLDGIGFKSTHVFYDGFNFSTIRFHFFFHRRSLYYTVYAVYPCLLMAALQLFSHTLPVEHPGRMALLTSLFIGSSVVQSSITASMPKSSDGVSVIQVYLMLYSASLLMSIIVTAVNMHIFYRTPDDCEPGVKPLLLSFLLTFGIRPPEKSLPPELSFKLTQQDQRRQCPRHSLTASPGLTTRTISPGSSMARRRGSKKAAQLQSAFVENETETNNKSSSSPHPPRPLEANACTCSDLGIPETVPASPTVRELRGEGDNSFIDEEDDATPSDSCASSSYYLSTAATTAIRPSACYEYLPFVAPKILTEELSPPPPPILPLPSTSQSQVPRSVTSPSVYAPTSKTKRNRGSSFGTLFARSPRRKNRRSSSKPQFPTFHSGSEMSMDWRDNNRRWSIVPTPTIFGAEDIPLTTMGNNLVIKEEENSDEEGSVTLNEEAEIEEDNEEETLSVSLRRRSSNNHKKSSADVVTISGRDRQTRMIARSIAAKAEHANKVRIRHDWLTYAAVIDKYFFYVMVVLSLIAPVILFLVMPALQGFPGEAEMNLQSFT